MYFCNAKPENMDFKQEYKRLLNESWQLIIEPRKFWDLKKEHAASIDVMKNFYLPFVVLVGIASFLGKLLTSSEFLFSTVLLECLREMLVYILLYYGAVYVSNELISGFKGEKNKELIKLIVAYSLFPFLLASMVTGLFPGLYALSVVGLYGIFLFIVGIGKCITLPEDYRPRYILITILVIFLIFVLLNLITGKLLQFFYLYGS